MSEQTKNTKTILDSRESVYGDRRFNMERIADVWSGILGAHIQAHQVPLMLAGLKLVRASETPSYEDNVKDVEGYAMLFREVVGDQMVEGATVEEYLRNKAARDGK